MTRYFNTNICVFQIYLVQNEEQDGERLMEKGLIRSVWYLVSGETQLTMKVWQCFMESDYTHLNWTLWVMQTMC